jgi:hypothetical protein
MVRRRRGSAGRRLARRLFEQTSSPLAKFESIICGMRWVRRFRRNVDSLGRSDLDRCVSDLTIVFRRECFSLVCVFGRFAPEGEL